MKKTPNRNGESRAEKWPGGDEGGPAYRRIRQNIQVALEGLIPLHIAEMRNHSFETRKELAEADGQRIASHADKLLYTPGKRPRVLSALARGIAALAYQPGGITTLGIHACAHPHPQCPASTTRPPCCTCDPRACTANLTDGTCTNQAACAWCINGCPAADHPAQLCCSPQTTWGRTRALNR
ncbi:hypothetical protein OG417_44810 [Actinoallomurus sp. NBC_01490]|uniref:hypothetical protein n=1 Tax=Actinoallomurus sp. NBC_01490 TaxID=2903557 RepID=UPI002E360D50|nr:hypothetical protein [Actinoallomurus sp. NBC_01490]